MRLLFILNIAAWALSVLLPCVVTEPLSCRLGQTPCKDGSECVFFSHWCDGERDCPDGSDEEECASVCSIGQFQCAHGRKCIDKKLECDGVAQCQDRSDETECFYPDEGCGHRCNKKHCVAMSFVCDGERDCSDGSDEADCDLKSGDDDDEEEKIPDASTGEVNCTSKQFQCTSGQCVPQSRRCDGHPDCPDRSDEEGCDAGPKRAGCTPEQQPCPNSNECLLPGWFCDGEPDCTDGSDEQNCVASPVKCGQFQWQCASQTQCVPQSWRCDGTKDCRDESDEAGCESTPCPAHQYQCGSSECIDPSLLCNLNDDCLDGSDEGGACSSDACSKQSQCAQDCYSTPTGMRCWCRAGYKPVDDTEACVDMDECVETPELCAHSCTNTDGSFQCSCNDGYVLQPDGRSCNATGEPNLIASVQSKIFLVGIWNSRLDVLLSSEKQPVLSLDYDWQEKKIYWVTVDTKAVKWSTLDQKAQGTLVQGIRAQCVAVDWVGRNLYWTDSVAGRINAVGLVGTQPEPVIILDEDLEHLHSLALLPQKGVMFWSKTGSKARLETAGMDGSNRRVLVSRPLRWPTSLALDPQENRLYWTDEKLGYIGSVTLDGNDLKFLQLMEKSRPFSLSVFGDMVYWSDTHLGAIQGALKKTGKQHRVLLKQPSQPYGVKVMHELLQPSVENPCASKGCSHHCMLAPGLTGACKCPSWLLLDENALTCSQPKDSTFLLLLSPHGLTRVYLQSRKAGAGLQGWPQHGHIDLPNTHKPTALDLVLREQALFVWDAAQADLSLFKLKDAAVVMKGTLFGLRGEKLTALAVDWVTLNIYWSSNGQPGLLVTATRGMFTTLLLQDGIGVVHSIALHPLGGRLCFANNASSQNANALLECANMDGQNRSMVWSSAVRPVSLSLSNDGDTLYWADSSLGVIASLGVHSKKYKEIKTEEQVVTFALADNVFVWVTKKDSTKVWFSDDQHTATMWFEVKSEVTEMKAFREPSQDGTNFCSSGNGGCSHLCLPFPGGRTCRCAHGYLLVNESTCSQDSHCPEGLLPCLISSVCLPREKFCNGQPDCPDQSDEICVQVEPNSNSIQNSLRPKAFQGSILTNMDANLASPSSSQGEDLNTNISITTSSTTLLPAGTGLEDNKIKVESVDAESCGVKLCNGNGKCVLQDGETTCECVAGYGGDSCQEQIGGLLQAPVVYAAAGFCIAVIVLGTIVGVIRRKKSARQRHAGPVTRDTSMRDLEKRVEASSQQNGKDAEQAEVPAPPVE